MDNALVIPRLGSGEVILSGGRHPRLAAATHPRLGDRERIWGGNRANVVVVENRDWKLYYSHWGGGCRLLDALIGGPDLARRYVNSLRKCHKDEWTDASWVDGGASSISDLRAREVRRRAVVAVEVGGPGSDVAAGPGGAKPPVSFDLCRRQRRSAPVLAVVVASE